MAQSGKASIKRAKPSYFMSILGVTLVLFLLGIIGVLVIAANKVADNLREDVEVITSLLPKMNQQDSASLMEYVKSKPYIRTLEYVTKEEAKRRYLGDGNESFDKILEENPLPNSINFKVKKEYVNRDSLEAIKTDLENQTYVTDVKYPEALVDKLHENIREWSLILMVIAILLALVVIILIDNTIRLAMFSNRFLIKTMQMVGATRWFIAKPMNIRAIINGAISGIIAAAGVFMIVMAAERFVPLKAVLSNMTLALLFAGMILLGIGITLISTHRSVLKYLKMKLDDLY